MSSLTIGRGPIEYQFFGAAGPSGATLVMLHEGLGSVAMWRDFPQMLADTLKVRVFAYSRHGYGQSAAASMPRAMSYMHDEALLVLPQILQRLNIERPLLFGHSDGGSIALIHASMHPVRGVIALAPHVFVEDLAVKNIAAAKVAFESANLRERLARYHADVDGAFWGWNDIWLHPDFRGWNIEALLPRIQSPILLIQGQEDEYGTQEQLRAIARGAGDVQLSLLPNCGHSPHRDQPGRVLEAVRIWMDSKFKHDLPPTLHSVPAAI